MENEIRKLFTVPRQINIVCILDDIAIVEELDVFIPVLNRDGKWTLFGQYSNTKIGALLLALGEKHNESMFGYFANKVLKSTY